MIMARGTAVQRAKKIPRMISTKVVDAWGRIRGVLIKAVTNILDGGGSIKIGIAKKWTTPSHRARIAITRKSAIILAGFTVQIPFKLCKYILLDLQQSWIMCVLLSYWHLLVSD